MLILTRKKTESIHIRDDIVVTVLSVGSHSVRLGIEAPRGISIRRTELDDGSPERPMLTFDTLPRIDRPKSNPTRSPSQTGILGTHSPTSNGAAAAT